MKRLLVAAVLAAGLLGVAGLVVAVAPYAQAKDILEETCKGQEDVSSTCQTNAETTQTKNPLTGTDGVLYKVSLVIASVAGVAAVIMIIISGFHYIAAAGDAQKIAVAKNTLIGAIAGLVIIALAQAIVTFVVLKL